MTGEIKESQAYVNYLTKYPHAQSSSSTLKHGMGKGLLRIDLDEALEYAKMVNMEEIQHQEKECRSEIVLERQVNKEVDEGYQHLKVKLKAKDQPSPEAHLFLNLKRQGKESKEQAILEEIKKKAQGEGSGATADHSSSSNDSSESANDAKTGSERDSDHDESDNNSKHGDEIDKSDSDEEKFVIKPHGKEPKQPLKEIPLPSPSVTTTSAEDFTRYVNDPNEVQMSELLNELLYTEATIVTVSPILKIIHETQEQVTTTPPATPTTKTKNKRAKTLVEKIIKKKNDWKKAVMQRLTNLEQRNHVEIIEE
ncbi:hypothetical protein Tco_1252666 [Tanacetum coccineum]